MNIARLLPYLIAAGVAGAETGWSAQGFPLISYSTDEGLGYGLRLQLVDHSTGEEKPYRAAVTAQFYQTTRRVAAHLLSLDAPGLLGSRNRLELESAWSLNKFSPYYGLGNTSRYQERLDTCADRARRRARPCDCASLNSTSQAVRLRLSSRASQLRTGSTQRNFSEEASHGFKQSRITGPDWSTRPRERAGAAQARQRR